MNKIPNPNYPLPEKWYVQRTLENAKEVNDICNQIFDIQLKWTSAPYIHSVSDKRVIKCYVKPQPGYTEVTYEDLWLAYMIPEKWYCVDVECKDFKRWRTLNGKTNSLGFSKYIVLSEHLVDNTYFWGGIIEDLKEYKLYRDYKEISKETYLKLLDILEQKKNPKLMETLDIKKVQVDVGKLTEKQLKDMCDIVKSLGFLCENLDIMKGYKYFRIGFGDRNSFGVFSHREEFTTLTYEQFIEHFKTKEKLMNDNIPTEVIIPIIEFAKIVDIACDRWKNKLRDYTTNNLQEDCISIKVTKDFYDQMIKASIIRDGVYQADIINSVLPMFKHDPYKVFKDAEKEGKTIQVFNGGRWKDIKNPSYAQKPKDYRIKHKHQDLIDEWEASGRTKEVKFQGISTGRWILTKDPAWNEDLKYRFKPEPKYVPFTFEDAEVLLNKVVKSKPGNSIGVITAVHKIGHVHIGAYSTNFDNLFKDFIFLDGSPCGKLVTE